MKKLAVTITLLAASLSFAAPAMADETPSPSPAPITVTSDGGTVVGTTGTDGTQGPLTIGIPPTFVDKDGNLICGDGDGDKGGDLNGLVAPSAGTETGTATSGTAPIAGDQNGNDGLEANPCVMASGIAAVEKGAPIDIKAFDRDHDRDGGLGILYGLPIFVVVVFLSAFLFLKNFTITRKPKVVKEGDVLLDTTEPKVEKEKPTKE